MFKDIKVSLICRIICLLTFIIVIFGIENLYVLGMLAIIVFFLVRLNYNFFISFLMLFNFIGFIIGYYNHSYILFRILLIISYSYYFLNNYVFKENIKIISNKDVIYDKIFKRNEKKLMNIKKGDLIDNKIVKDKTEKDFEVYQNKGFVRTYTLKNRISMQEVFYVLFHLFLLFISIIIGSCVI